MTIDDAKRFTLWMQAHGVTHFQLDDLRVVFNPRSVKVKERNKGARGTAPVTGMPDSELTIESLFPGSKAVDANSYEV